MRTVLVALASLLSASTAWALDQADHEAARATIERQIEAFRKNDPDTAYAQAAPAIRNMFPSAETFIAMVEKGYKPVLRPRSYSFDSVQDASEDEIAQGVQLQDEDGTDWIALYSLQKQGDGAWRITGCTLRKAPGTSA